MSATSPLAPPDPGHGSQTTNSAHRALPDADAIGIPERGRHDLGATPSLQINICSTIEDSGLHKTDSLRASCSPAPKLPPNDPSATRPTPPPPNGFAWFLGSLQSERVHQNMRSSLGLQRFVQADNELAAASGVGAVIALALPPWPDPNAVYVIHDHSPLTLCSAF